MTAKDLLLELIKRQKKGAWRSKNWTKLEPEIKKWKTGMVVYFRAESIGFSFDSNGRFEGIFNYKE